MSRSLLLSIRILICIVAVGYTLFAYIDKHNELTELRIQIPQFEKEVKGIKLENKRLQYKIDQFESPIHLMEMSRKPEFSHLKNPYLKDVIILPDVVVEEY